MSRPEKIMHDYGLTVIQLCVLILILLLILLYNLIVLYLSTDDNGRKRVYMFVQMYMKRMRNKSNEFTVINILIKW